MKKLGFVDLLKLRASYGEAGQSSTGAGRYPYQSIYGSATGYGFGYNGTFVNGYALQHQQGYRYPVKLHQM